MPRLATTVLGLILSAGALMAFDGETPTESPPTAGRDFQFPDLRLTMLWVEPGTFIMSSTMAQEDDTEVTLSRGYWLGQTEVTEEQWEQIVRDVTIQTRYGRLHPATQVHWESVIRFCQLLTARERAAGRLPAGYVYTLPTEAQWEYACRAGTTGPFAGDVDAMAWHRANSGGTLHPVAQKQPNAWGFYDMHGNAAEWCLDYFEHYPGGRVTDPRGPLIEQFRISRGGNVGYSAGGCRSNFRGWGRASSRATFTGFRLALAPEPATTASATPQPVRNN